MARSERPRQIILFLGFAAGLVWLALGMFNRYSSRNPYLGFGGPARRFFQAAMQRDSAGLAELPAAPAALRWALDTERGNPALLRRLAAGARVMTGMHNGDRTVVFFKVDSVKQCETWDLTVFFSGPTDHARIEDVALGCP